MKKRIASLAVLVLLAGMPVIGGSQVSFGGLASKLGGGDLAGQQDRLVRSYVAGGREVLLAQSKLLEALGLKEEAATVKATADALGEGATQEGIEEAEKAIAAHTKDVTAAMKSQTAELSAESKKIYVEGLLLLAAGLIRYNGMRQDVAGFSKGLAGPGALTAGVKKLQEGAYIIRTLPGSIVNTVSTLGSAISFARSHGIDIPANATAALG